MTDQYEKLLKAKIPCEETGIEIKHTICDICAPAFHCGIDAYVKDGVVIKIEGTKEHPVNKGLLCTKGLNNRQYIYRKDRIKTPLKRVGEKGKGEFEPISWEQAYEEISKKLFEIKEKDGADSVAFFAGYGKWFRPTLHRFAYSFGSVNYGTESSTCSKAGILAWDLLSGNASGPELAKAGVYFGWTANPYYSQYVKQIALHDAKDRGAKIIIVDPRITPTVLKDADLHLRLKPGTDGALALGIAKVLIDNGWIAKDFIEKNVYGFEEYAEYVKSFDFETVEKITGVKGELIYEAAKMIHENLPMCINENSSPGLHHTNGMQNYRAIMSLAIITGCYDVPGGQLPINITYIDGAPGFNVYEEEFLQEVMPKNPKPRIGAGKFPVWMELTSEMQAVDLSRQILEETPYPVKGLFACGMNFRMFPDSNKMVEALKKLDFFVDLDLFLTDTAKYADIVLPVCSSFERGEFKTYGGGFALYTNPVIKPLFESKSDVDVICELAKYMNLDDELLKKGYEACINYMIRDLSITIEQLKKEPFPILVPEAKKHVYGEFKPKTPSGKYELKSQVLEKFADYGLDALPTYRPSLDYADENVYPFALNTGSRLPNALHSRLHDVSWARSLRPDPMAEISKEDAESLGIVKGDKIEIATPKGSITVLANPTVKVLPGIVHMYHGYREADVNSLIDYTHTDPYSGFPGYGTVRCSIRKVDGLCGNNI